MAEIVLQFSSTRSLGSVAIRLFQHGWATHVDTVIDSGSRLLGARHAGGVAIRPVGYQAFTRTAVLRMQCAEKVRNAYLQFLGGQLGKPYDSTAIAAFAFGRDWRAHDSWFCSELVMAALESASFVRPLETPANRVTPEMLMFLCSAFVGSSP